VEEYTDVKTNGIKKVSLLFFSLNKVLRYQEGFGIKKKRRVKNIKSGQQKKSLIVFTMGENLFHNNKLKSACRFATSGF